MVLNPPPNPDQPIILGFDPGRHKCGLAAMGVDRTLHYHQVIAADEVVATIQQLQKQLPISIVVMGDQTTAKTWKQKLSDDLPDPLRVVLVDERYSSLEARDRYWKMYPPKGLYRLIPQGMRTPPRSLDDIVAILLIERYLERLVASA
ncbi:MULTISPECIES: pre-16S rRNA-processing nuclease YqgF [Trichocoleus]|uniref:Pre-16S rRNA-processing nuclease YqgF n=1 Tax=Trichocoleus desertorum GB2-A4 TaxID=2933944 RepID=A0ABV0J439_9CYAN|nr:MULTISPECIES: pre-16S rRNA-processing nuclease YqgF [unclassified Trichocoleus]MBD1861894.1 pre-16S rRNA-processing nuclease YqgF [Trichocoleus sp. FACHB-46]MBD2098112.1 pre-16S rRNA-processing nuclease YqgF [Trichocoleus sp. FACHB-591]MBD2123046.1 pre-16S rRNA-processing nuclease YqgF [Trichocoleus sp. FACHB-262]